MASPSRTCCEDASTDSKIKMKVGILQTKAFSIPPCSPPDPSMTSIHHVPGIRCCCGGPSVSQPIVTLSSIESQVEASAIGVIPVPALIALYSHSLPTRNSGWNPTSFILSDVLNVFVYTSPLDGKAGNTTELPMPLCGLCTWSIGIFGDAR